MIYCLTDMGIQGYNGFLHDIPWYAVSPKGRAPMLFNIPMCSLAQLIWKSGLGYHQYADDTQLYLLLDRQLDSATDILATALEVVADWFAAEWTNLTHHRQSHRGTGSGI